MRAKYIFFLLAYAFVVSISTISLNRYFLYQERLNLIDQQARETAATLIDSELSDLRRVDFNIVEEIISEELGENRVGKFFVIRDSKNELLYESNTAKLFPTNDIDQTKQWDIIEDDNFYVRILNLKIPRIPNRTLQIGVVVTKRFLTPPITSLNMLLFCLCLLLMSIFYAIFSLKAVLYPITTLANTLKSLVTNKEASEIPLISIQHEIRRLNNSSSSTKDEFDTLVSTIDDFIKKINSNYNLTKSWSYQLAHEIKTPLSIIQNATESYKKKEDSFDLSEVVMSEVKYVSELISDYLQLAELYTKNSFDIHACDLGAIIQAEAERLGVKNIVFSEKFEKRTVFCNKIHLRQLVSNILTNAKKYAGDNVVVNFKINNNTLIIQDDGPGLPQKVLSDIGLPFNRDKHGSNTGSGLGIALIFSICNRYKWGIEFANNHGVRICITFND